MNLVPKSKTLFKRALDYYKYYLGDDFFLFLFKILLFLPFSTELNKGIKILKVFPNVFTVNKNSTYIF